MAHEEDTPKQQSGQEKPVVRRDKVVVTKVTSQELSIIKSNAEQCGMTRSDFIRARSLGYKPRQRLSDTELDGLRQLATCRTEDGHGELRQRPARIDRQREDKTFPAPADHA